MKTLYIDSYQVFESQIIDSRAKIFKAKTKIEEEICVKIIQKSHQTKETLKSLERERDICRKLKTIEHQNIIKYYDIIDKDDKIYFFMEYCPTTLDKFVESQQFTYKNYLDLLYQISSGYKKLIELQIIHRDIKLDNIVLKQDQQGKLIFKIIDFGTSKILGQVCPGETSRAETKNIGTQLYMAPEIFNCNSENYDNSCDIYSLGIIIVLIMCGKENIAKEKWVSKVRQNIEEKSIKEFIQIKDVISFLSQSVPSQIVDIVDCMVTARRWRISWEYLNIRVEQLRFQMIEEKKENPITPKKPQNAFDQQDGIQTAKKSVHNIILNNCGYNSFPTQKPLINEISQHQQFNNQQLVNKNINNALPIKVRLQGSMSFYQNNNQDFQVGLQTDRISEKNKNQFQHCSTEGQQPDLIKKPSNYEYAQMIRNPNNQQNIIKLVQQQQNNQNFKKPEQNLNNQNSEKTCQQPIQITPSKSNLQNQQNINSFFFSNQKPPQQNKVQQQIKHNQSLSDLKSKEEGRLSHQNQQSLFNYQGKNQQFKTINHK